MPTSTPRTNGPTRDDASATPRESTNRLGRWVPGAAGAGYLAAWAAGLLVWPANVALDALPAQVVAAVRPDRAQASWQYLLVEGVAGLLLGVVLLGLLWSPPHAGRLLVVSGAVAVTVSLVQCLLGLALVAAASADRLDRSGELFAVGNRLDGLKMIALAIVALGCAWTAHRQPAWLRVVAALAGVALLASGVTYLGLVAATGWTVYVSGPLLLLWVAASGVWLTVRARQLSSPHAPAV